MLFLKSVPLLVVVLASIAFPLGDSLNFEAGVYVVGNPVVDSQGRSVDGWEPFVPAGTPVVIGQQPTILVQQSRRIAGGGKVLDCHGDASSPYGVMRAFNPPGGGHIVDMTWSWNAENDTVDMCLGLASVPPGAAGAPPIAKATVCIAPGGTVSAARGPALPTQDWVSVTGRWLPNTTYYTRIKADMSKGTYAVFASTNPQTLEDTANRITPPFGLLMQTPLDGNRINRFFINASHRPYPGVDYSVEVDRISWFTASFNVWTGAASSFSWHSDSNWSLGSVPDSNHFAIFDTTSTKACTVNRDSLPKPRVLALLVTKSHGGPLNIAGIINLYDTLTTLFGAEISGGNFISGPQGVIRYAFPMQQTLLDTGRASLVLPPIHQAGPGLLTLATYPGNAIRAQSYTQTGGGLNLYIADLELNGDFTVSGTPNSPLGVNGLYGMGGRTITVGGKTRLFGSDTLNRLVVTSAAPWVLRAADSVNARNAVIRNSVLLSTSTPPYGEAINSVDSGGNSGWVFWNTPVAVSQPVNANVMVGARAVFRVTTADSAFYQWQEWSNSGPGSFVDLPNETADSLVITGVTLEADNSVFRCRVWNPAGTIASNAVTLRVRFPAPTANPPPGIFGGGNLNVALDDSVGSAALYFSVGTGNFQPYSRGSPIVLTASATIQAYAVLGPDTSAVSSFTYTGLAVPVFSAAGADFTDRDTVTLSLPPGSPNGSTVRCIVTGPGSASMPEISSPACGNPIVFDSAVSIKAIVVNGSLMSAVRTETYAMAPSRPIINPPGGAYAVADTVLCALTVASPAARIYYTLDGSNPTLTNSILYSGLLTMQPPDTVVKAIAVAGSGSSQRISTVATATFTFLSGVPQTLGPNSTLPLTPGYSLRNPSPTFSALFTILPSDSVANSGFQVRFALRLQPEGTATFPSLRVLGPAAESLSLYFISNNNVYYRGNIDTATGADAEGPGKYFIGTDTQAPYISLPPETVQGDGSTRATFTIQDNVVNLKLDITRSDTLARLDFDHTSPNPATFILRNTPGSFRALTIRIHVRDGRNTTQFPAPPTRSYALAQRLEEADGPPVWAMGTDPVQPWDLIGLPFLPSPALTLKDLRDLNQLPYLAVQCCYSGGSTPTYRTLSGSDTLPAGQALWMANDKPRTFLKFPAFNTAALGDQSLRTGLNNGWNAVSSRRLDTLFWPTTRRNPNYFLDTVNILRALWAYDAVADLYAAADTMLPWRGYWVYNRGSNTTVSLLTSPPPASKAAAAAPTLGLSLLSSRGVPLYLGAEKTFSDAFGREDEPMLPAPSHGPWASLLRGRHALMTDQITLRPGLPMEWRLVLSSTAGSSRGPASLQSDPTLWNLPAGYEVWAVSEQRGLRFELKPGGTPIQSPVGFTDTLRVFAAPSSWIASTLGALPTRVDVLAHHLVLRADRLELELQWPGEGPMRAEVFDPSGRMLASVSRNLPAGFYRLPLVLPRGRGLLFVRVTGRAGAQHTAWTGRLAKP